MTRVELKEVMLVLDRTYDNFIIKGGTVRATETIDDWYMIFKNCPYDIFQKACAEHIVTNVYKPRPANIYNILTNYTCESESGSGVWNKFMNDNLSEIFRLGNKLNSCLEINGCKQCDVAKQKLDDLWETANPSIKKYFGDWKSIIKLGQSDEKNMQIEKSKFERTFTELKGKQESKKRAGITTDLSESLKKLLG